jgi:hypothetical protein
MAELGWKSNNSPLLSDRRSSDMDGFFATPALWVPGMSDEDWAEEVSFMLERAKVTADFANGLMDWNQFLEGLNTFGIDDPRVLEDNWSQGLVYL